MMVLNRVRRLATLGSFIIANLFVSVGAQAYQQNIALDYYEASPRVLREKIEDYHLKAAQEAFEREQLELSWGELLYVLHYYPNHPDGLQLLLDHSLKRGVDSEVTAYFERALDTRQNDVQARRLYAQALYDDGRYEAALDKLFPCLLENIDNAQVHHLLGLTFLALKRVPEAQQQADLAYKNGYADPLLRDKLKAAGAWQDNT